MEQQTPPQPTSPIGRGHNVVHVLPADWSVAATVVSPLLGRLDGDGPDVGMLIVTADADAAEGLTRAIATMRGGAPPRIVAATGVGRAARVIRAGAAAVVVGAPGEVVGLLRASALKLDALRVLVVAWVDDILDGGGGAELEAVMAEVPREVPRIVIASSLTSGAEDFIGRYAWRAPRVGVAAARPEPGSPASSASAPPADAIAYLLAPGEAKPTALRRVLDALDPPSAAVYVRSPESERAARDTLLALGYHGDAAGVRIVRDRVDEHAALLVLYDLPPDHSTLADALAASPARTVAFALPRQLAHLRGLTTGPVRPLSLGAPFQAARARDETLREEIRQELGRSTPARELIALEPLLAEHDGVAVAAAAVRILEREREARAAAGSSPVSRAVPDRPADEGTRRPGDRRPAPDGRRHGAPDRSRDAGPARGGAREARAPRGEQGGGYGGRGPGHGGPPGGRPRGAAGPDRPRKGYADRNPAGGGRSGGREGRGPERPGAGWSGRPRDTRPLPRKPR